jgi:catechol 2,3-dioxygenase-like lactoylglutathione lyase family enzyme
MSRATARCRNEDVDRREVPVPAIALNHVSVAARELEESVRFYEEVFTVERIATPNFGFPVQWLRVGAMQLHLFERPEPAPTFHHFALTVDDLEATYAKAEKRDAFDRTAFGHHLYELPGDCAQLYLRDPAGNLVEVNAPGASALPASLRSELRRLEDVRRQSPDNLAARLYLGVPPA